MKNPKLTKPERELLAHLLMEGGKFPAGVESIGGYKNVHGFKTSTNLREKGYVDERGITAAGIAAFEEPP